MLSHLRARLKDLVKDSPLLQRRMWHLGRRMRAKGAGYFDWSKVIDEDARGQLGSLKPGNKKILIATSVGAFFPGMAGDGVVGAALALRGQDVHYLLCDELLPACLDCELRWETSLRRFAATGPQARHCSSCFPPGLANYSKIGPKVHRYSEGLSKSGTAEANALLDSLPVGEWEKLEIDGVSVGDHAKAGLLRFLARGTLTGTREETAVFRRYMIAGILTLRSIQRLLKQNSFEAAVVHHGIYIPQGIIAEACRLAGVRVVTWNVGYRKNCLLFSHNETYHHAMMDEPTATWEDMTWSEEHDKFISEYLKSRWYGTNDWIWFHDKPTFDLGPFSHETGFDPSKPAVGMLTNVFWDAQLHYPKNVFQNMLDWVFQTVDYFVRRPDIQLLIRIHPAEIRGTVPSRERVVDALRERFPNLPPNIILVGPENKISTYPIMEACDAVVIYGTKTGVELTSVGIPTIVAGEAWIRNKGLTHDPKTQEEYFALLDRLPFGKRMDDRQMARARRYAFHFFFRRMIPVSMLKRGTGVAPVEIELASLDSLKPGRDPGLDVICRGIIDGTPFVFPQEDLLPAQTPSLAH